MLKILLPPQFSSETEKEASENISDSSDFLLKAVLSSNFLLNLLMFSSLSKMWSTVNGIQVMAH